MPFRDTVFLVLALAVFSNGCGMKPGMQGGPKAETSEIGSVQVVATETPTGQGDTTSFNPSDEEVEKVGVYRVKRGDSLWRIASRSKVYGSGWLYPLLVKSNKSKIKDPKDLKIGSTLIVPRDLSKADYEMAREDTMAGTYDTASGYDDVSVSAQTLTATSAVSLSPTVKPSPTLVVKKVLTPPVVKKKKTGRVVALLVALGVVLTWFVIRSRRRKKEEQDPEPEVK